MTFADIMKHAPHSPEQALKAVLAGMGWTHATLAKMTGYTPQTIRNVACGARRSLRARRKIEAVLCVRIWNPTEIESSEIHSALTDTKST